MADLDEHFLSLVASLLAADAFGLPLARGAVASRGGPHGRDGNTIMPLRGLAKPEVKSCKRKLRRLRDSKGVA